MVYKESGKVGTMMTTETLIEIFPRFLEWELIKGYGESSRLWMIDSTWH